MSFFITVEGPEGSGKTTQVRELAARLRSSSHHVIATHEPGGTPLGEQIRELLLHAPWPLCPETEALLVTAARAEHVTHVIRPALEHGHIVICDRYIDSTLAYQGAGRGLDLDQLWALQRFAFDGLLPDLTILIDVPVEVGLARRYQDAEQLSRFDRETLAFHERVRAWYLRAAHAEPARWRVFDGTLPPEIVAEQIWATVQAFLHKREQMGARGRI